MVFTCQLSLHLKQKRSHRRNGGDLGCIVRNLMLTNGGSHIFATQIHVLKPVIPIAHTYLNFR